jgi:hypothetical protein
MPIKLKTASLKSGEVIEFSDGLTVCSHHRKRPEPQPFR